MSQILSRRYLGLVAVVLLVATALAVALVGSPRAQALPPLCPTLFVPSGPPTLSVTASPATIDANSGTSLIEARPLNADGLPPTAGCEVDLGNSGVGSLASTGVHFASRLTNTLCVATDNFRCNGFVGAVTIAAWILLSLPDNILVARTLVECTAAESPDLRITKSHAPDPFQRGGQGQFTLTVSNAGPGATTGTIVVTDIVVPAGITFTGVSPQADWDCTPPFPVSGPATVVCSYLGASLAVGSIALSFAVEVAADFAGDQLRNCASVEQQDAAGRVIADRDPRNNSDCDSVAVVAPVGGRLWLEKVDQDGNPVAGAGFSIAGVVGVTVCVPDAAGGVTCHVEDRPVGVALACTTDALGECHFEGLAAGDYVINETLIPAGYTFLGCEPSPATVPSEGGVTVRCRNEQVEAPDLSLKKRHGSLDVYLQDDTGVDYIILECPGCVPTLFQAGLVDNFMGAPEPSSPSPALLSVIQNCSAGALQAFDPVPQNRCFGYTFTGLPEMSAATLTIRLRAHPTDPATNTDGLALQLTSGGTTFVWSIALNDLIHWATSGGTLEWTSGSDFTFDLDLAALPLGGFGSPTTSILRAINNFAFSGSGQFVLMVTNNGLGSTTGPIVVTDTLPPGLTYVSASNGDWNCSASVPTLGGQTVTCEYIGPPLQPGESAMVTIYVAVGSPSDFTGGVVLNPVSIDVDNCATVEQLDAAGTVIADPDPSNNTVCDRVVMEGAAEDFGLVTVTIPGGTFSVWTGPSTTASQAFAGLDVTIWRWNGSRWELYATSAPVALVDFTLERFNILFNAGVRIELVLVGFQGEISFPESTPDRDGPDGTDRSDRGGAGGDLAPPPDGAVARGGGSALRKLGGLLHDHPRFAQLRQFGARHP